METLEASGPSLYLPHYLLPPNPNRTQLNMEPLLTHVIELCSTLRMAS